MGYIKGDRTQMTFLPPQIEDYIGKDDPVRAYDAFVEAIDFTEIGIRIEEDISGANPYWPKAVLKILVYGYSYGIRSSRKLERACSHNLSFIWLTEGIKPDYRTIARFRTENKEALKKVLEQCVRMCIKLGLIEGSTLFVDGTKIKANAALRNTWTNKKCKKYLKNIGKRIEELIAESEKIDKEEEKKGSMIKLREDLQEQKKLEAKVKEIAAELKAKNKKYINTVDNESIKGKSDRGVKMYHNGQLTVDGKHGLIVNADIVEQVNDANQMGNQIKQAKEMLGKTPETVCADTGYYDLEDLKGLPEGTKAVIPSQQQVLKERDKKYDKAYGKEKFKYNEERDLYECPEKKILKNKGIKSFNKENTIVYQASGTDCKSCKQFGICTKTKNGRKIVRFKDEKFKEELEKQYSSEEGQNIYKLRKEKAELPFGHIKRNMGMREYLLRGTKKVKAEFSLSALGFNLTRMITIIGVTGLKQRLLAT